MFVARKCQNSNPVLSLILNLLPHFVYRSERQGGKGGEREERDNDDSDDAYHTTMYGRHFANCHT